MIAQFTFAFLRQHSLARVSLCLAFLGFAASAAAQSHVIYETGHLGGQSTHLTKVNDNGQAIGQSYRLDGQVAVVYSPTSGLTPLTLGGTYAYAYDINDLGDVVGQSHTAGNAVQHAFIYSGGTMSDLNALIPANSGWVLFHARAINNAGQIIGQGSFANQSRSFLYTPATGGNPATIVDLGTLGGTYAQAVALNASGQVVGYSNTASNTQEGFFYSAGTMTSIGTINNNSYSRAIDVNDSGQVIGESAGRAFRWVAGTTTLLPLLGGSYSYPSDINNAGEITGYSNIAGGYYRAVKWTANDGLIDLGTLGGNYSQGVAINESGHVVGWSYTSSNSNDQAFLHAGTMTAVSVLVPSCGTTRLISYAYDIGDGGQIVGVGYNNSYQFGWWAEPGAQPAVVPSVLSVSQLSTTYGASVELNASLSASACGVSGQSVAFTIDGANVGSATTNSVGRAQLLVSLAGVNAGTYPTGIQAFFSGNASVTASSAAASLRIAKARPVISWSEPAPISSGSALSAAELNASADAAGTFTYSPPAGTVLPGGAFGLSTTFVPSDEANYISPITESVRLVVTGGTAAYSLIDLGDLGGNYSYPQDLNEAGQVAGTSRSSGGYDHAFLYDGSTMSDLGTLGGNYSYAYDLNDDGQVVGQAYTATNQYRPFRFAGGALSDLGSLGGSYGYAWKLNEAGMAIGQSRTAQGYDRGFAFENGSMTEFTLGGRYSHASDLNASGQVVGYSETSANNAQHAFLYSDGTTMDLGTLGGQYSYAQDINDAGDIVGHAAVADGSTHPFLYRNGVMTDLGTLGGNYGYAQFVNEAGQVAGVSRSVDGYDHAFLYANGSMIDLGTLLAPTQSYAAGLNDAGQVAGYYIDPSTGNWRAFLHSNGVTKDLGTLGGGFAYAYDINDAGWVAGYSSTSTGEYHAFVYRDGVMIDLGTLGGSYSLGQFINSQGQVAGQAQRADGRYHAFLSTPALATATSLIATSSMGAYGGTTTLGATLTSGTTPLAGKTLAFELNNVSVGNAVTDATGTASISTVSLGALGVGSYTGAVAVTFTGDSTLLSSMATADLSVTPATLIVTANNASRTYGAANPGFSATIAGFVNSDTRASAVTGDPSLSSAALPGSPIGGYAITAELGSLASANYAFSFVEGTLTVGVAGVSITPDDASRTYGAANPSFTGSIEGVQNGDNITAAYATVATVASGVGPYDIVATLVDPDSKQSNYVVTLNTGVLTVTAAMLTVTADNAGRLYGSPNPAFTVSYNGFQNGDGPASLGGALVFSTAATTASPVGNYPVLPSGQTSSNYTITFASGTLSIGPAPLVVSADAKSKQYSDPLPAWTASSAGFVNGEGPSVLGGTLTFGTTATMASAPGTYPITPSGLTSTNYAVSFANGLLTVVPEDARPAYSGSLYTSTASATSNTAAVVLAATIQDITAVTGDPATDADAGDIRLATLTFVNRDAGNAPLCTATIGLVNAADQKTGAATCNWTANIGSSDSQSFTIGMTIGGRYVRNASTDNEVVTVSRALASSFITGGGYLRLTSSAGEKAGQPGSKNNFGFSVKFNKSATNLQGHINTIVRSSGRVYQIKGNSMSSLATNSSNPSARVATFNGKANITDITDPLNPLGVDGNGTLQVVMTDRGEPGSSDSIAITLWNKDGGLWFSSRWDDVKTIEQTLGGGNLHVK